MVKPSKATLNIVNCINQYLKITYFYYERLLYITFLDVFIDHNNAISITNIVIFAIILIFFVKFLSTLFNNAFFQTMKQHNTLCASAIPKVYANCLAYFIFILLTIGNIRCNCTLYNHNYSNQASYIYLLLT